MSKGILGRKIGMTQIFNETGEAIPVTVIEAGPCPVVQVKNQERDGYTAVQLGFGVKRETLLNKPRQGHLAKAGSGLNLAYLREFRLEGELPEVGSVVKVDTFKPGDIVDIIGTSRGKGFAGTVKRYHFNRGPMSHGSMYHRRPGSLAATDPARVFKGRRLPGRMGGTRVTVQNLKVVKIDPERNLLLVQGAVPGVRGGLLMIRDAVKTPVKK